MTARRRARLRRRWRALWAAPCTALGLVAALPLLALGARARRVGPTLEIGWMHAPRAATRCPFAAITLGRVILGTSHAQLAQLRAHERTHVRQYEAWGAVFLLAYPLASAAAWLNGQPAYAGNRFEVAARRAATGVAVANPLPLDAPVMTKT